MNTSDLQLDLSTEVVDAAQTILRTSGSAVADLGSAGLLSLGVAQDAGGSDGTLVLAGLVAEQAGAHGATVDTLHHQIATLALADADAPASVVEQIGAGARPVVVSVSSGSGGWRAPANADQPSLVLVTREPGMVR